MSRFCLMLCSVLMALVSGETGLKFNGSKFPFAEFKPWDFSNNGAIEIYFKTAKKDAILLYQDDGEGMDWIDVFLIEGKARLRLRMGNCLNRENTLLNGNFTDLKWHHLKVKRNFTQTTISIDGFEADSIYCEKTPESPAKPKPSKTSLYLGGIPVLSRPQGHWANPTISHDALDHIFTGCIARVRYTNGDKKLRRIRYRKSSGTTKNCAGACVQRNSCKNNGKCVDMLVSMRCNCNGTGHVGKYCERKVAMETTNSTVNITMSTGRVFKLSTAGRPLFHFPLTLAFVLAVVIQNASIVD